MNSISIKPILSLVLVTGCGAVIDPTSTQDPSFANDGELAVDGHITPASPLLGIEAPRAATGESSLFARTFASGVTIQDVPSTQEGERIDVIQQRITTKTDQPIALVVDLAPPTGTFSRVLVSDSIRLGTQTGAVLCERNNLATYDAKCETAAPAAREMPGEGSITASKWRLSVRESITGAPMPCVATTANHIECVLPGHADTSYEVVASAYGFEDLWDGSAGLGVLALGGITFTGALAPAHEYQCWDWATNSTDLYCMTRYEFVRFTAIDRARLELDPITTRITANGMAPTALASPALAWDAGNDDVPGAAY